MVEAAREQMCRKYLETYGAELRELVANQFTVVINCQEGLYRSREFTAQLLELCLRDS